MRTTFGASIARTTCVLLAFVVEQLNELIMMMCWKCRRCCFCCQLLSLRLVFHSRGLFGVVLDIEQRPRDFFAVIGASVRACFKGLTYNFVVTGAPEIEPHADMLDEVTFGTIAECRRQMSRARNLETCIDACAAHEYELIDIATYSFKICSEIWCEMRCVSLKCSDDNVRVPTTRTDCGIKVCKVQKLL